MDLSFAETLALEGIAASIGSIRAAADYPLADSTRGDLPPEEFETAYCADHETPSHPVPAPA